MQPLLRAPSHYVPCGIDLDAFSARPRAPARARWGVPEGAVSILFPSSPNRDYKNYPGFTAVAAELRARGHAVHELVLNGIAREDVPDFMAAADVMVLTSTQEGTPVAVMEALSCGLPVVATDVGDVAAMLADATPQHAYAGPFDVKVFADEVERLRQLADDASRESLPGSEVFDGLKIGSTLVDIYEAALRS